MMKIALASGFSSSLIFILISSSLYSSKNEVSKFVIIEFGKQASSVLM